MSGFALAPEARLDLIEIWNYYAAETGDLPIADRIRDEIFCGIRKVVRSPGSVICEPTLPKSRCAFGQCEHTS